MAIKVLSETDQTGNKIINLGAPSADTDAATKGFAKDRANHIGTQLAATISDFDEAVQDNRLSDLSAPNADVSMNGQKITNLAAGTSNNDAVNKSQLDTAVQAAGARRTARAATTGVLPDCTYSNGTAGVGATLTGDSNGALVTIDGVDLDQGDTLLVKNQENAAHNGLYIVTQVGDGGTPFVLTRSVFMDSTNEMGALVAVQQGTANTGGTFLSNGNQGFVVGTDELTFTKTNAATAYDQGNGIDIAGNEISVDAGTGLTFDTGKLVPDFAVLKRKASFNVGNGSDVEITVTHNFGTRGVDLELCEAASPYRKCVVDWRATTTNTVTMYFGAAPSSNEFVATVSG